MVISFEADVSDPSDCIIPEMWLGVSRIYKQRGEMNVHERNRRRNEFSEPTAVIAMAFDSSNEQQRQSQRIVHSSCYYHLSVVVKVGLSLHRWHLTVCIGPPLKTHYHKREENVTVNAYSRQST